MIIIFNMIISLCTCLTMWTFDEADKIQPDQLEENITKDHTPKYTESIIQRYQDKPLLERPEDMTADDLKNLTPEDIDALGFDIANIPKDLLKHLSGIATRSINPQDFASFPLQNLQYLNVPDLNPNTLSMYFQTRNIVGTKISDELFNRFTNAQKEAIITNANERLDEYFTPQQIDDMKKLLSNNITVHFESATPRQERAHNPDDFPYPVKPQKQVHVIFEDEEPAQIQSTSNQLSNNTDNTLLQPSEELQPVSPKNPIKTVKPSWWRRLSPTLSSVVDYFVKKFSPNSNLAIVRTEFSKDEGVNVPKLNKAITKLTTKQKELVVNDWFKDVNTQLKDKLNEEIKDIRKSNLSRRDEAESIREQINGYQNEIQTLIEKMQRYMQQFLSDDEQLVVLYSETNQIHFECIDMTEINPSKPIQEQLTKLVDDGVISVHDYYWIDNKKVQINAQQLEDLYASWVAKMMVQDWIDHKQSTRIHQIPLAAQKITSIPWDKFNPKLQDIIQDKINKEINRLKS